MKRTFYFIVLLAAMTAVVRAQDYSDPQNMDVTYSSEASYKGGESQLIADIWSKMEYSREAIDAKVDGNIMVSFTVNADSTVSDVSIIMGMDYGINEEFVRVLKTLRFVPATVDKNPIKMSMSIIIPIRTGPNSKLKQQ